jgi:large subunit ribosomal protein L19
VAAAATGKGLKKMKPHILEAITAPVNPNVPELAPGDTVVVSLMIREGAKQRVQDFKGTIIRLRKGGNEASFTVRRIASHGIGVERTFLIRSPRLQKVVVTRHSRVRRAQLYYLRDLAGKAARLKERRA